MYFTLYLVGVDWCVGQRSDRCHATSGRFSLSDVPHILCVERKSNTAALPFAFETRAFLAAIRAGRRK